MAFLCPAGCSNLPNPVNRWDDAFVAGLGQSGYVLGGNAFVDLRGVGVGHARLLAAAKGLVQRKVDVIVAFGNEATRAARDATSSIPIVMLNVVDAASEGLVASLGRPGANVTGLSVRLGLMATKHIELLKEINPRLKRVGVLWNSAIPSHQARFERLQRGILPLDVQLMPLGATTLFDLERAFASMGDGRPDGLLLLEHLLNALRSEIALFALKRRLVTVASDRYFVDGGGLLAYGPSVLDLYERAGIYAGKLLKGVRPAQLPVEEPTRFELIVNQQTAKALGVTIPPSLLLRADLVVE